MLMTFARFLNEVTQSMHNENTLSDSLISCTYAEIPVLLSNLEQYLTTQGIQENDCVAVECINSVPSALLLMLLLKKRQGFVLLPASEKKDEISTLKPVPQFCQYRLIVKPVNKADAVEALKNPALFLTVESHNTNTQRLETQGKLFLRTSGSMGAAKIVVHDHDSLLGSAKNVITKYQLTAEDRFAIPVPIFHLYGFGAEFLPAILLGASMDLQEKTNLLKYLDRERRFNPTVAFVTPNLCEMLLQGRKTPRPYKIIVVSGQRIKEELFRAFDPLCGSRLVNQYGSTEMGPIAACCPEESLESRVSSIGSPMNGVELRIEKDGNLYCKHPYHFAGYMDEEGNWLHQADEEWHRTGDIAIRHENGSVAVTGRADNSINRSGYLILLADVERLMEQLNYLSQVAVIATKAENIQGQKLIAFCVLKPNQSVEIAQIFNDCKVVLPKYAVPDDILLLNEFPLLPSGKTDQQALHSLAEKGNEIDVTTLLNLHTDSLKTKQITDEKVLSEVLSVDFEKVRHALIEIKSTSVNQVFSHFFSDSIPDFLAHKNYSLSHVGFEIGEPLDIVMKNLPHWLEKLSAIFETTVTLKRELRFSASAAFQQRVNAAVEILCLWLQVGEKLMMLELFDIAHPIANLLPTGENVLLNSNDEAKTQRIAMDYLFENDNIWHYSISVGNKEVVQQLHDAFNTLTAQESQYKLAYAAPIQNQYDGSFHTKLINLTRRLELEFVTIID
jgi:acyl-CoA synthetase (AMP-forming)/AMP-acid ligase II